MCLQEIFKKIYLPPVLDPKLVENSQTVLKFLPNVNSEPPPLLILKVLLMELLYSWFGLLNTSLFRLKQHEE